MNCLERCIEVFELEISELNKLKENLGEEINEAVERIYQCRGKLVVMGIGKTGIIGHKIASSLASTGTQAIFVNAAEAIHGDLGMIAKDDIILLISNSGCSGEILNLITPLKRLGCYLMAMTGNKKSALAKEVSLVINIGIEKEACSLGLAPTTSTTATLVMGDALMVCLMEKRNFKAENFALYHPGGALGRQLLSKVKDEMNTNIPKVDIGTSFKDIVYEVSNKRLGMTIVYDNQKAVGIITDGDIRSAIKHYDDIKIIKAKDIMTPNFKRIPQNYQLTEALELMDKNDITTLAVMEEEGANKVVGIISIHHIINFQSPNR
jgi:arabinose-5-phosphate isomerase